MKKNSWFVVRDQSLARYARFAGFDLAVFDEYPEKVRSVLKMNAIREALYQIENECEEQGLMLRDVQRGVYVISLSRPLSVRYSKCLSPAVYIGMGNIRKRIRSHFENTLFDLMQDLSGANFDFHFAVPGLNGTKSYYKHVEFLMLDYFAERFGGMAGRGGYPLLNSNAGSDKGYRKGSDWWKMPLKIAGKRPLWEIAPTVHSGYKPLDTE